MNALDLGLVLGQKRPMSQLKISTKETQAVVALIYTAVLLTVLEYIFFPPRVQLWLNDGPSLFGLKVSLQAGVIWALGCFVGYLLIPAFLVRFWHKESLSSIAYNLSGFRQHIKVYLLIFAGMSPLIYIASQMPAFQNVYPFIPEAKTSLEKFLIWELVYILQFISLEAFFRGYLLFTLEKVTHAYVAIAVMVIPYAMIHFHKPMLETFGAVLAGMALGWLSLRYRSWAGGALVHALVAVTMDTIACARAGLFNS